MEPTEVIRRPPFGDNPLVGERGASTQRRILDAALSVFAEVGFHDTRVELITEAAGCSRPAFYQYFASKDDVFWHLARQLAGKMDDLAERLSPVPADRDGVRALARWLDELVDLHAEHAPIFSAFQAAIREQARMARGSRDINERFGAALIRAAGPDAPDFEDGGLAGIVATMLIRTVHYWRIGVDALLPRERLLWGMAEMLHRLLLGPIPGVNVEPMERPPSGPPAGWPEPPDGSVQRTLRARGQETWQRLLDAGTVVLPSRGYHETRVDDVVEQAGVSHGTFYRYFENKDDLFRVLGEQASGQLSDLVDSFPADGRAEALRRWLEEWFEVYRSNGGIISVWQEIDFRSAELEEFSQQVARSIFERLVRIVASRDFGDPEVEALGLLALVERVPYNVFTLHYLDRADAVEAVTTIARRGILGLAR